jgi:hypothetical protein
MADESTDGIGVPSVAMSTAYPKRYVTSSAGDQLRAG